METSATHWPMPERDVDVRDVQLRITWDGESVSTRGRIRLSEHELLVEVGTSRIRLACSAIQGAELRLGTLTVFSDRGTIASSEDTALQHFWMELTRRACTLPELTVGLRALGSRRGGDPDLQGRFFAPLISARRRLEEQESIEWRLAAFDAEDLRGRTTEVLRALVAERASLRPSARRSLEAQVLDEADGLFGALAALGDAADAVRSGDDANRFVDWRLWAARARDVFVQADRCWMAAWPLLNAAPTERQGRSASWLRKGKRGPGRAAGVLAFIVGAASSVVT